MSDSAHAADIKKQVRTYMMVFGALAVLTILTVAVAYIHMSIVPALIVALVIASVKGGLVAAYFMHLNHEKKVIYVTLLITAAFFLVMVVLFLSSYHDQFGGYIVP